MDKKFESKEKDNKKVDFKELKHKYWDSIEENSLFSNKMVFDSSRIYVEKVKSAWGK